MDPYEYENEIKEVRQAIADRLQLQKKLLTLEKMITTMINARSTGAGAASVDATYYDNTRETETEGQYYTSGYSRQSSSFPDASLALKNLQQRACCEGQQQFGYSDTSPETSTVAEVKVNINYETDSSMPQSAPTTTTYASNCCSPSNCNNRAARLADLTSRVMRRGFEQAEDHTLHELSSHLREFLQERSRRTC